MFKKKNKYNAVKSNGYDSIKEHKRAIVLKLMERGNLIKDLQEQVKFELVAGFRDNLGKAERSVSYIADFVYFDNEKNSLICEDVKSSFTKKLPLYVVKRKLFKTKYPDYIFIES
jgi:hypothetical protein